MLRIRGAWYPNSDVLNSRIHLILLLSSLSFACDDTDIGQACPELADTGGAMSGEGRSETEEIVAVDPRFPCDDLICIATNGVAGYCSRKCRSDVSCPSAFECRTVQPIGEFANDQFCAWKQCASDGDCGDPKTYCCREDNGSDPVNEVRLCGLRDEDC